MSQHSKNLSPKGHGCEKDGDGDKRQGVGCVAVHDSTLNAIEAMRAIGKALSFALFASFTAS